LRNKIALLLLMILLAAGFSLAQPAPPADSVSIAKAAAPVVVTFPNPNIFLSPYNWRLPGDGTIWGPLGGEYLKFSVTGTTQITANVDTTVNSTLPYGTDYPTLKVIVDDSPAAFVQFAAGATTATLASGLSPTAMHSVLIFAVGGNQTVPSSWTDTAGQTHINSLQFDAGAKLAPYPRIYSKSCLIYGDSYLQGFNGAVGISASETPYYQYIDPSMTWAFQVGKALGCETGVVGVGGSGYLMPVSLDGQPALSEYWNSYDSTHARSLLPAPDYMINALGINDHRRNYSAAAVQNAVSSWLVSARSAMPSTKIFFYIPVGGQEWDEDGSGGANATPIKNAVSLWGDANTFLIDAGTALVSADNWRYPTWFTGPDGLHPSPQGQDILALIAIQQIQKAVGGLPGGPAHPTTKTGF
jgi:lysophospholipase L1-like esterase